MRLHSNRAPGARAWALTRSSSTRWLVVLAARVESFPVALKC